MEGTPGRSLLDEGIFKYSESRKNKPNFDLRIKAKCDYDYFDFSSHSDNIHIHNYIENLNFKKDSNRDIFCIHGDSKSTTSLASELVMNMSGVFTTPYGVWADMVYSRATAFTSVMKVVKDAFDPNNIMNPGKLCF